MWIQFHNIPVSYRFVDVFDYMLFRRPALARRFAEVGRPAYTHGGFPVIYPAD